MKSKYDILKWIWFATACIPGSSNAGKLLGSFSSAEEIYDYDFSSDDFDKLVPSAVIKALRNKDLSKAERLYEYCEEHGILLLPYCDIRFPAKLRMLKDPPALLYCLGTLPDFSKHVIISAVGTRSCTEYGINAAHQICSGLARAGVIIVSGMALGIDGASHTAALSVDEFTIAVLGSGVDVVYPKSNENLYHQICRRGLVMSEYPPLSSATRYTFPERNRIISGLSDGVLIIEADQKSGALITAKDALFQGRDLFAVPGSIFSPASRGPNQLIAEGAKLVTDAYDILTEYQAIHSDKLRLGKLRTKPSAKSISHTVEKKDGSAALPKNIMSNDINQHSVLKHALKPKANILLSETEKAVLQALAKQPKSADEIAETCSLPAGKALSVLMSLEIKKMIKELPGGQYSIIG
ncbi:MAG: DNA-protecting protein DprA [Clostridiales bacterium]|nr:DNA-protecting protein DprA [Clostridiales bacterium]